MGNLSLAYITVTTLKNLQYGILCAAVRVNFEEYFIKDRGLSLMLLSQLDGREIEPIMCVGERKGPRDS